MDRLSYGTALLAGFRWLMKNHPEVFVIGQGLWSPWYVGNSMTDLDKEFGRDRVIDSPVSEASITGVAVGAALSGKKPIIVHPRMDFMLYSMDAIVNQAAKWRHMMGGGVTVPLTVRAIVNRGGEQGAQHSQSLHSWFAHIPGLRVVMPASVSDARDLLIASVLSQDPVIFIDDRWLYDQECEVNPVQKPLVLEEEGPRIIRKGKDITLIGTSYSVFIAKIAADNLRKCGIDAEVIDIRVLSPLKTDVILQSVKKTGRALCIDGGWSACGFSSEILAILAECLPPSVWKAPPKRITLPFAPAPSSSVLEAEYYPDADDIYQVVLNFFSKNDK